VKNATGDYTVTFSRVPFAQTPVVSAIAVDASGTYYCSIKTVTATAVNVLIKTDAGVASDCAFHLVALGSGSLGDY